MGQLDRGVRILVIDPDVESQLELSSARDVFDRIDCLPTADMAALREQLARYDVIVVGIDCRAGLDLVANLCARPYAPPVMAICGRGFEGKSPEHVLVLAELRGAVATLPKPLEAGDLVISARSFSGSHTVHKPGAAHSDEGDTDVVAIEPAVRGRQD